MLTDLCLEVDFSVATQSSLVRLLRDELVHMCEVRGLEVGGTKPQLARSLLDWVRRSRIINRALLSLASMPNSVMMIPCRPLPPKPPPGPGPLDPQDHREPAMSSMPWLPTSIDQVKQRLYSSEITTTPMIPSLHLTPMRTRNVKEMWI